MEAARRWLRTEMLTPQGSAGVAVGTIDICPKIRAATSTARTGPRLLAVAQDAGRGPGHRRHPAARGGAAEELHARDPRPVRPRRGDHEDLPGLLLRLQRGVAPPPRHLDTERRHPGPPPRVRCRIARSSRTAGSTPRAPSSAS